MKRQIVIVFDEESADFSVNHNFGDNFAALGALHFAQDELVGLIRTPPQRVVQPAPAFHPPFVPPVRR